MVVFSLIKSLDLRVKKKKVSDASDKLNRDEVRPLSPGTAVHANTV